MIVYKENTFTWTLHNTIIIVHFDCNIVTIKALGFDGTGFSHYQSPCTVSVCSPILSIRFALRSVVSGDKQNQANKVMTK